MGGLLTTGLHEPRKRDGWRADGRCIGLLGFGSAVGLLLLLAVAPTRSASATGIEAHRISSRGKQSTHVHARKARALLLSWASS